MNEYENKKDWFNQSFLFFERKNEIRTRDPNLGKVVLYQPSYFRIIYGCKYSTFFHWQKLLEKKFFAPMFLKQVSYR